MTFSCTTIIFTTETNPTYTINAGGKGVANEVPEFETVLGAIIQKQLVSGGGAAQDTPRHAGRTAGCLEPVVGLVRHPCT